MPGSGRSWVARAVGPSHKVAALVTVAAFLALAASIGVAYAAGFSSVRHVLAHPDWFWLGIALAAEAAAYVGYTFAYREVARAEGGAELDVPRVAALVATGFGVFLQGGGFSLDREALKRTGMSDRDAGARVLGLSALEYAVLAPATVVAALVIVVGDQDVSLSLTAPWIVGVPVGGVVALVALRFKSRLAGPTGFRAKLGEALHGLELVLFLLRSRRHGLAAFAGIALYWAADITCLWATVHAFSEHVPIAQLIVGYATGYAVTRRALPLGGAGAVEALLPFALGWVGIALAPAVVAVFAYRVLNLWLPMLPALGGLPALSRLERRHGRRRPRAA